MTQNKVIEITPNNIIDYRNHFSKEITQLWYFIKAENVVPVNYKRHYSPKACFKKIEDFAKERILTKLFAQAINMGYSNMEDFPKDSLYFAIFELSEVVEQLVHLQKVKTLKSSRGKGKMNEELSATFIKQKVSELQKKELELRKKIEEYNKAKKLIISAPLSCMLN